MSTSLAARDTVPAALTGEEPLLGLQGIEYQFPVVQIAGFAVDTIAQLKSLPLVSSKGVELPPGVRIRVHGYLTKNDGGGGKDRILTYGAIGEFSDDGLKTILPSSGDGSRAWISLEASSFDIREAGAVAGGNDCASAIRACIASGFDVELRDGTYWSYSNLTFDKPGQKISLHNASLVMRNPTTHLPATILVTAPDVVFDLGYGSIDQHVEYAEVAVDTTPGGMQIQVTDASNLVVGQGINSSWGAFTTEPGVYPLYSTLGAIIQSIVGNVVTLDRPMAGAIAYLPAGLVIGNWNWSALIQVSGGGDVLFRNGTFRRVDGYYYATPTGGALGDRILFDNIIFASNGYDQFNVHHSQQVGFRNCKCAQQWDPGKAGIRWEGDAYVKISDSVMALGNADASFVFNGAVADFVDATLDVINSEITGETPYGAIPDATLNVDAQGVIVFAGNGTVQRIRFIGVQGTHYTRHLISSGLTTVALQLTLNDFVVDGCYFDTALAYFAISGGNWLRCTNPSISNTRFVQSDASEFLDAGNMDPVIFVPHLYNCVITMPTAGQGGFRTLAYVANTEFRGGQYKHERSMAKLSNCRFTDGVTIACYPTYDRLFAGSVGEIVIDDASFPQSVASIISYGGSTGIDGLIVAQAKSAHGTIAYMIAIKAGAIVLSAKVEIVNGVYQLVGDDYYVPVGSIIHDLFTGLDSQVTFALPTSLTATAAAAAASIDVADATSVAIADHVNIKLDSGLVHTTTVAASYAGGLTIPLDAVLPSQATSGALCNFFRV